jgi:hypothetical protein
MCRWEHQDENLCKDNCAHTQFFLISRILLVVNLRYRTPFTVNHNGKCIPNRLAQPSIRWLLHFQVIETETNMPGKSEKTQSSEEKTDLYPPYCKHRNFPITLREWESVRRRTSLEGRTGSWYEKLLSFCAVCGWVLRGSGAAVRMWRELESRR